MNKQSIINKVRDYGQKEARRIAGNELPSNFIDQFLVGDSLFSKMIDMTIELTEKECSLGGKGE